jgi:hypothetical protein
MSWRIPKPKQDLDERWTRRARTSIERHNLRSFVERRARVEHKRSVGAHDWCWALASAMRDWPVLTDRQRENLKRWIKPGIIIEGE